MILVSAYYWAHNGTARYIFERHSATREKNVRKKTQFKFRTTSLPSPETQKEEQQPEDQQRGIELHWYILAPKSEDLRT